MNGPRAAESGWSTFAVAVGGVLALVAGLVAFFVLRGGEESGPSEAAEEFAAAWADGERAALDDLVVDPAAIEALDPVIVVTSLGATATAIEIGTVQEDEGRASAGFGVTLDLGDVGEVAWEGSLVLAEDEERGWLVDWSPGSLHPALAGGGTLRRSTNWPERASILGVGDQVLVGPTDDIVVVGIEPRRLQDRVAATAALFEQLDVEPATVDTALDAPGARPDQFVPIVQITRTRFEAVRAVIYPIPGLLFREAVGPGGPDPRLRPPDRRPLRRGHRRAPREARTSLCGGRSRRP